MLYTENIFVLTGGDVTELLAHSPQARRMKNIKLKGVTPLSLEDQQNLNAVLGPVDHVARHCDRLTVITIPSTNSVTGSPAKAVVRPSPSAAGR